eukprot:346989-Alexandrium_andersonii.AAC.1
MVRTPRAQTPPRVDRRARKRPATSVYTNAGPQPPRPPRETCKPRPTTILNTGPIAAQGRPIGP